MPTPTITTATVWEDGGASLMARVVGNDAANITQASISSITCNVYDAQELGEPILTPTVVVSTSVFESLQTDARWTVDSTGYNFRHDLPATAFPDGGKCYRVVYKFTPVSGEAFYKVFDLHSLDVVMS